MHVVELKFNSNILIEIWIELNSNSTKFNWKGMKIGEENIKIFVYKYIMLDKKNFKKTQFQKTHFHSNTLSFII
jgi:hypothetical protein